MRGIPKSAFVSLSCTSLRTFLSLREYLNWLEKQFYSTMSYFCMYPDPTAYSLFFCFSSIGLRSLHESFNHFTALLHHRPQYLEFPYKETPLHLSSTYSIGMVCSMVSRWQYIASASVEGTVQIWKPLRAMEYLRKPLMRGYSQSAMIDPMRSPKIGSLRSG